MPPCNPGRHAIVSELLDLYKDPFIAQILEAALPGGAVQALALTTEHGSTLPELFGTAFTFGVGFTDGHVSGNTFTHGLAAQDAGLLLQWVCAMGRMPRRLESRSSQARFSMSTTLRCGIDVPGRGASVHTLIVQLKVQISDPTFATTMGHLIGKGDKARAIRAQRDLPSSTR